MAKRDAFSDEDFGAKLCKGYDTYEEHREAGRLDDNAPGAHEIVNQLFQANRAAKARDENSGLGPKEIERTDHGADNPPEFAGKPANPAQDSAAEAIEEARIRHSGSATMDADLHAARARRSDPRKIRGMSLAIKGYDRIK